MTETKHWSSDTGGYQSILKGCKTREQALATIRREVAKHTRIHWLEFDRLAVLRVEWNGRSGIMRFYDDYALQNDQRTPLFYDKLDNDAIHGIGVLMARGVWL